MIAKTVLLLALVAAASAACTDYTSESACFGANAGCDWCVSKAVPSVCCTPQQASTLPPNVFICHTPNNQTAPEPAAHDVQLSVSQGPLGDVPCGNGKACPDGYQCLPDGVLCLKDGSYSSSFLVTV